jgi:hypothetical protein
MLAIVFYDQISIIGFCFYPSVKMMGRYSEEPPLTFKTDETYVQSNIQCQKLNPQCEINKHVVAFRYQFYRFILDVYQFSKNCACVAK